MGCSCHSQIKANEPSTTSQQKQSQQRPSIMNKIRKMENDYDSYMQKNKADQQTMEQMLLIFKSQFAQNKARMNQVEKKQYNMMKNNLVMQMQQNRQNQVQNLNTLINQYQDALKTKILYPEEGKAYNQLINKINNEKNATEQLYGDLEKEVQKF